MLLLPNQCNCLYFGKQRQHTYWSKKNYTIIRLKSQLKIKDFQNILINILAIDRKVIFNSYRKYLEEQ